MSAIAAWCYYFSYQNEAAKIVILQRRDEGIAGPISAYLSSSWVCQFVRPSNCRLGIRFVSLSLKKIWPWRSSQDWWCACTNAVYCLWSYRHSFLLGIRQFFLRDDVLNNYTASRALVMWILISFRVSAQCHSRLKDMSFMNPLLPL